VHRPQLFVGSRRSYCHEQGSSEHEHDEFILYRNASLLAHTARGSEEEDMRCDTYCGNGYSSVSILSGQGRSQELSGVSGVV
jgi:hypothetical protein